MKNRPVTWNRCRRKNHQVEQGHIQYIATWIELGSATKIFVVKLPLKAKIS
jgi:cytochrome oxidase assembly protein ShyY1